MTRPTKNDDDMWLDALAGRPHDGADPKINTEAERVRKILQKQSTELEAFLPNSSASDFQKLYQRLEKEQLVPQKVKFSSNLVKKWSSFIAAILSAFAFGALVMRYAMMPTLESVRSVQYQETSNGILTENTRLLFHETKLVRIVSVRVEKPNETMRVVSAESARLGLDFSVMKVSDGYTIVVIGLVPNSVDQEKLKSSLGLSKTAGGDLLFDVKQKTNLRD